MIEGAVKGIYDVRASQAATIHGDHIETRRSLAEPPTGQEIQRQPRQPPLLAGIDGLEPSCCTGASASLHLYEHPGVAVARDEVDFAARRSHVAAENLVAATAQKFRRGIFCLAAELVTRVHPSSAAGRRRDALTAQPHDAAESDPETSGLSMPPMAFRLHYPSDAQQRLHDKRIKWNKRREFAAPSLVPPSAPARRARVMTRQSQHRVSERYGELALP